MLSARRTCPSELYNPRFELGTPIRFSTFSFPDHTLPSAARGRDLAMVLDQSPALDQNSSVEIISSANSAAVDFVFRPILPIQNYTTLVIHEHYCDYLL